MADKEKYSHFTLEFYLDVIAEWAKNNDIRLYENIDDIFSVFHLRNKSYNDNMDDEQKKRQTKFRKEELSKGDFDPIPLFIKAIELADFHDALKFNWLFVNQGGNRDHSYVYGCFEEHPYISLRPYIKERHKWLENNGLASWRKSTNRYRNEHFRYWIRHIMEDMDNKTIHMKLFPIAEGNSVADTHLNICGNYHEGKEVFDAILQYVLDNNIITDPHRKELRFLDPINPDHYSDRIIKVSGAFGGFGGFVSLTALELQEIYKTKIKKRKLNYFDKANWAFINACPKNDRVKFYIYMR